MSETMSIEDYLAQGGILTAPGNVPPRYRGELLRLMASFVDSELAASAGFASSINFAPGIRERIAASRITLEKADHAERVLAVMADFGTDTDRYQSSHDWAARVPRDSDLGAARREGDMRLSVFHYPITGWTDAVVMNVLQGLATGVQMTELALVSYAPLAEVFRAIAPREARHAELGLEGLARVVVTDEGRRQARESLGYWRPRIAAGFGAANSARYGMQARWGIRHTPNEDLLARWDRLTRDHLAPLGL
ncbi:phenylacetic acid catabolic [Paracoccus sediminis]|uniref:1,2-phenylacetyl-CoA epoxidase, catalytic subunit n=1 Tax=Paracoccus sediminis TaxID=1214787 RepID=A0A238WJZ8_9RHOB|nr:Phenylacetic acid catabolic protein [Paracoccus sediminis]TBN50535.1 phenylacetic acid catabolic [Paracoccus sediminis]SNR46885.1 1,2-phenylacetyl-CoA epoxidase, catalytic subunit [Paracoccus sediminis]